MIERTEIAGIPSVVYLPDPFLGNEKLPVVTIFRAKPDEWFQSRLDHSRGKRNVFTVVKDLIDQSYLKPCGFIFPQTCNHKVNEFYFTAHTNERQLCVEPPDTIMDVDHFCDKYLPELGQRYEVDIERVSLDGFSLGGYTSLAYSFLKPERFISTGSFDGSILDYNYDNKIVSPETPSDLTFDSFPYLFGSNPSETNFRCVNPVDIIQNEDWEVPGNLFIMHSNENHPTSNKPRVLKFLELMQKRGVSNSAGNALLHENSMHEWYWVDEYLYRSLPFHSKCLEK